MQLAMENLYDSQGKVLPTYTNSLSGYKRCIEVTHGLTFIIQEISCKKDVTFTESITKGIYISLLANKAVSNGHSYDSLHVTYSPSKTSGSFTVRAGETKSLLQIQIQPYLLAQALNESTENCINYLTRSIHKLAAKNSSILTIPVTSELITSATPLLVLSPQRRLRLMGDIYAFIFLVLEQVQILTHMLSCADCQSKLFNVQNLLETDAGLTKDVKDFAHQAGLSVTALELSFHHLVGQTVTQYRNQVRLKRAAAMLRTEGYTKLDIVKKTGFSETQLETLFMQHFGVPTAQYGQVH
ncbi:helix-turn-helix domain-containing protein [Marinomonas agarivorans]|nr:helix-turn-helix domain-containing protein [Marinomonas agarivorans]